MKKRLSKKREKIALQYLNEHKEIVENAVRHRIFIDTMMPIETYTRKPMLFVSRLNFRYHPPKDVLYREFARSLVENEDFVRCVKCNMTESHYGSILGEDSIEYVMSIDVLP